MEFRARVENFNSKLWSYHIKVPQAIAMHFKEEGIKRLLCTINDNIKLQCAIMPAGDGVYFINLNKKVRDQMKLKEGSQVSIKLERDDSEFGLPFPVELEEVLEQDKSGKEYFYKLTPGKQRNILHAVGQVKNSDLRIKRAMIMINHLKANKGKLDFRQLNQELRSTP